MVKYIERIFEKYLPSPLALAVILSLVVGIIAFLKVGITGETSIETLAIGWLDGFWSAPLMVFALQMILILVLGHALVLSRPADRLMQRLIRPINSQTSALLIVCVSTMLVAFFNWGLGLIFGAVMTRKAGEKANGQGFPLNYALLGAAGYSGLMVWHGGISGSAPLKVAEAGHLDTLMSGYGYGLELPNIISTTDTIFSIQNLLLFGCLLIVVPVSLLLIGKNQSNHDQLPTAQQSDRPETATKIHPADRGWLGKLFGGVLMISFLIFNHQTILAGQITPNTLNLIMLSLGLMLHDSLFAFAKAIKSAITGASGILIQFPIYFGILALMRESGLVTVISNLIASIATETSLPILTFFSAGLVNIFVPSGGGQWAVQGPILLKSAVELGVPLNKAVMALAYGDQITNMLQPFWALPLLGITGIKAKKLLPYTLVIMVSGSIIFIVGLLLW